MGNYLRIYEKGDNKADEKEVTLNLHTPKKLPAVLRGDPLRLEQILINLGDNAIKLTDSGGVVVMSIKILRQNDSEMHIHFCVEDTGIEISDEDREKSLKSGMNDFIAKPFHPEGLFRTMEKWITPVRPCMIDQTLSQENESNQTDAFPELTGIDTSIGLYNTKNRIPLYYRLLRMFRDNQKDFETSFRIAQSEADPKKAERVVHTLKGLAGTIGALKLHEAAKELEMGCRDNVVDIETRLEKVISELELVLSGLNTIESYCSENDVPATCDIDKTKITKLMHELYDYLSDYDTSAKKVIHSLLPLMKQTEHAEAFEEIANAVEMLDLELAKEKMEKFDNPFWTIS